MGWHALRVHCHFHTPLSRLDKEEVWPSNGTGLEEGGRERSLTISLHPFWHPDLPALATGSLFYVITYVFMAHLWSTENAPSPLQT